GAIPGSRLLEVVVAVVAGEHVPPDGLLDLVVDEAHAAVHHGHVHAADVPAARLRLLERAAQPGAHAVLVVIDRGAVEVVGAGVTVVGVGAIPGGASPDAAGARHPHRP